MSEKENVIYINEIFNFFYSAFNSYCFQKNISNQQLVKTALTNSLKMKGRLLQSTVALRKAILQSNDTALQNTYSEMNTLGKWLVKQYGLPKSKQDTNILKAEENINILEKALIKQVSKDLGFNFRSDIFPDDIREMLDDSEAYIDFIQFPI